MQSIITNWINTESIITNILSGETIIYSVICTSGTILKFKKNDNKKLYKITNIIIIGLMILSIVTYIYCIL